MTRTAVYVVRDGDEVLYIGVSCDPRRRLTEHLSRGTLGGREFTEVDITWYPDRQFALTDEAWLIAAAAPPLNTQHNGGKA